MELNAEQIRHVESLGPLNKSPEQVAMILNIDRDLCVMSFSISDTHPDYKPGHIKYHFDRGALIAQVEVDKGTLKRAKDGNQTSIQQFKKDVWQHKVEQSKLKTIVRSSRKMLSNIERINDSPEHMLQIAGADYEQVEFIRELFANYGSKSQIIDRIRQKWTTLRPYEAERLFNEVVNFYYINNNEVKTEAWKNIYAERLDNLFMVCYETNDFETARRCLIDAAELRGVNKEMPLQIPPEILDRRPILYSIKISDLGMSAANRNDLASFIDNLEVPEKDKLRLRRDALIEDIPFEMTDDAQE